VKYAIAGGNAVASWVSRVDVAAVRNTQDVNVVLRRDDLDTAREAMEGAGFVFRRVAGVNMFLDGADARPRDAVHIVYANELVRAGEAGLTPDVEECERGPEFCVLSLEALVRDKLTA
jgi:hypothetical protein